MANTVAETIKSITRRHLKEDNGLLFGQCVTAVGWIGGTVPEMTEDEGIAELSMADVSGAGIAVGAAVVGRRPIYVIRYQGFMWYNAAPLLNYAAKSKDMWNVPCPILVRSIAMEGGMGPVASGSHHGMVMRMPGMPVCSPMTPGEWREAWEEARTKILDLGNSNLRASQSEISQYTISWNRYVTNFIVNNEDDEEYNNG